MTKETKQSIAAEAVYSRGKTPAKQVIRTEFRSGGCVTETVTTRTVCFRSSSAMRGKTLSPGARRQTEQFYSRIDHDISEYERELRRKAKALRKAKRRIRRLLERQEELGREVAR